MKVIFPHLEIERMGSQNDGPWYFGISFKKLWLFSRWWFEIFFIFIPIWGNDPI